MALWDGLTEGVLGRSVVSNLVLGTVVVLLAPVVLPATVAGLRPFAKILVKGRVLAYDTAREIAAEAGEQFGDLMAEVRAELAAPAEVSAPASSTIIHP
jgi:hypothetical protein